MSDIVNKLEARVSAYAGNTIDYQLMKEALTELNTRASYIRDARNVIRGINCGPDLPTDNPHIFVSAVVPVREAFLKNTKSFDETELYRRGNLRVQLERLNKVADGLAKKIARINDELDED